MLIRRHDLEFSLMDFLLLSQICENSDLLFAHYIYMLSIIYKNASMTIYILYICI